jgi:hypothetical protein
MENH